MAHLWRPKLSCETTKELTPNPHLFLCLAKPPGSIPAATRQYAAGKAPGATYFKDIGAPAVRSGAGLRHRLEFSLAFDGRIRRNHVRSRDLPCPVLRPACGCGAGSMRRDALRPRDLLHRRRG